MIGIWRYISGENPKAADNLVEEIEQAFRLLSEFPQAGHFREDLTTRPYRFYSIGDYTIIYRPVEEGVRILRVVHGARDIRSMLD